MQEFLIDAKNASRELLELGESKKNMVLSDIAKALRDEFEKIVDANSIDMKNGRDCGLSKSLMDRLFLDKSRVYDMAKSVETIAGLKEPIGRVLDGWNTKDGLKIQKVTIPIGVIGIIYESRPNVTSDTAALCFKSSNVCVLKGGSEAQNSNNAIIDVIHSILSKHSIPKHSISLLPDSSREGVSKLIKNG